MLLSKERLSSDTMNRFVQLSRPIVVLMGVLFLFAAAFIAVGNSISSHLNDLLFAVPVVITFVVGGNSINDYSDRNTDIISHPNRPIPSGRIAPQTALHIGIISLTIAAAFSLMLPNITATCIVVVACLFIVMYELYLKKKGFLGNITIGVLTGMVLLLGGAVVSDVQNCYIVALMIFLISLGQEIVSDIEDLAGDIDRNTLPKRFGIKNARYIATASLIVAALLSIFPILSGNTNTLYPSVIIADLLIFIAIYSIYKRPRNFQVLVISAMFMTVLSFLLGSVAV